MSEALHDVTVADGFRIELVYAVPLEEQGSWVALTPDASGRLITSDEHGRLYRVTVENDLSLTSPQRDRPEASVEQLNVPIGQVQGLLYAYDSLYAVVNNLNKTAGNDIAQTNGLYRLQDTNDDDQFDKVSLLRRLEGTKTENAHGEHGPHGLQLGPDGQIYFVTGNGIQVPKQLAPSSPYRGWADDLLVPSGDVFVPGGWIARTNSTGTDWELLCGGLRNPYDIAFNLDGELFTADADSEADIGMYWYRPTRINHILSGAEYGWRCDSGPWTRHGKWPDHYPDSVGSVIDIGQGSPAGITFGTGARFPAKYQRAMYVCDWATARIYAVHLEHDGASYAATLEPFLAGKALPLTDVVINHDGAMYFTVGGRKTQSGLFRIRYVGDEATDPIERLNNAAASAARQLRRRLEEFHGRKSPRAVEEAWPHLASDDRAIRYAARLAIEHQELALWQQRALSEDETESIIQAMLALARVGGPELHQKVVDRLNGLISDKCSAEKTLEERLTERQLLDVLRAYSLAFIRMGAPQDELRESVIAQLEPLYPASGRKLNRELCQLLMYLEAPAVVDKTLQMLRMSSSLQDQMFYIAELSQWKGLWTYPQLRSYFSLTVADSLAKAGANERTAAFIRDHRQAAIAKLGDEDRLALQDAIERRPTLSEEGQVENGELQPFRPFVRDWRLSDLAPLLSQVASGRSYSRGKLAFKAAQCTHCHSLGGQGGTTGPDLTSAGKRFQPQYLLEALVVPSKVVSDRYRTEVVVTKDGRTRSGRVVFDDGTQLLMRTNPLSHHLTEIAVENIEDRKFSEISEMPRGLINVLTQEEILDLIAYLRAADNPDDAPFKSRDQNRPPKGFTALFNGRDLDGWKDDGEGHWRADDGVLAYDGKGNHLFTEQEYGDFILLIDWKIEDSGNSGVFLRGQAQVEIWDNRDYGTDLGSGGIVPYTVKEPLHNGDAPIGEWNRFRIRVENGLVTVHLNDQLVLDRFEPHFKNPRGPIFLQHHDKPLWFRNIFIKELDR